MKIIIDEKVCLKHKMTVEEVLMALCYRQIKDIIQVHDNLINRKVFVYKDGETFLDQHWSDVLDEILCDSSKECKKTDDELLELAQKMRELYPQGKMKDHYGRLTPYYYRCNNSEVVKKLKKFLTLFGNVSDEDILDATRRYVASFRGNYTNMRLIKYFILKDAVKPSEDGENHVEQVSDLATFLENKESDDGAVINDEDWLLNSRN